MRRRKLPPYCTYNRNRHGTTYIRFRRNGFSCNISAKPGTKEFDKEYGEALSGVKRPPTGINRTTPGSMKALSVHYYMSPEFRGLAESTQKTYRGLLDRFLAEHGNKKVRNLERRNVKKIIGSMSDRQQVANNLLKILRRVLNLAVDIGMIDINPAQGVKGFPVKTEGFHTWTEEEIDQFLRTHQAGSTARLAITLLLYTAQRRGDVVRMGRQHIQSDRLRITQEKTGTVVDIPLHPELATELAKHPSDNMTFLLTSYGRPFTSNGFGNWFRKRCREAGLVNCSAHGLRKAASRRMAECGKTPNQISAITGHKTLAEIERYTRAADRAGLANDALDGLTGTK